MLLLQSIGVAFDCGEMSKFALQHLRSIVEQAVGVRLSAQPMQEVAQQACRGLNRATGVAVRSRETLRRHLLLTLVALMSL
jgi:hypothetical protein